MAHSPSQTEERWTYSVGEYPNTVLVVERRGPGTPIYSRYTLADGTRPWQSLGHKDKKLAKKWAVELNAKLVLGSETLAHDELTLGTLFDLYTKHETPKKSPQQQLMHERCKELFERTLGAGTHPARISSASWKNYYDSRLEGSIDSRGIREGREGFRGKPAGAAQRSAKPVPGGIIKDVAYLRAVGNWATLWLKDDGEFLLNRNYFAASRFDPPRIKNPRQPVATVNRFAEVMNASTQVMNRKPDAAGNKVPTFLGEILMLCAHTGRRIEAVLELTFSDIYLDASSIASIQDDDRDFELGAIHWRPENDKMGFDNFAEINAPLRLMLEDVLSRRGRAGSVPLFPSAGDPQQPVTYSTVIKWLRRAEKIAGLESLERGGFHPYRRMYASLRSEHFPLEVIAQGGGWRSVRAVRDCYVHARKEAVREAAHFDPLSAVLEERQQEATA